MVDWMADQMADEMAGYKNNPALSECTVLIPQLYHEQDMSRQGRANLSRFVRRNFRLYFSVLVISQFDQRVNHQPRQQPMHPVWSSG